MLYNHCQRHSSLPLTLINFFVNMTLELDADAEAVLVLAQPFDEYIHGVI
jgi:hypothetical protein